MLLDLGRNDVGRVAQTGSVQVTERMVIERYSHVMHIVSNVEGTLQPGLSGLDVLRAAFPARTVSGAPPLRVVLGNAAAVGLRVNDQPLALAGLVRHDGSARLLIEGDGRTIPAPPRLAHGD